MVKRRADHRALERLLEALSFLKAHADGLAAIAEREGWSQTTAPWWPREPIYAWKHVYGDFDAATLAAGVRRGLVDRPDPSRHGYLINQAGRDFLLQRAP